MANCCSWLSRRCCCRREPQHAYIYLYSPKMPNSSSSSSSSSSSPSSSSSHCCLVCVLFGLCLVLMVILAAVFIYHLNSTDFHILKQKTIDHCGHPIAKKRLLPDFVNINIDPCVNFYGFVCDKWIRQKKSEIYNDKNYHEELWLRIRHEIHDKLMSNVNNRITDEHVSSVYKFYQLCESKSPILLLDEVERYFANLSQQEPYRSYATLFNRTNSTSTNLTSYIFLEPNPFFKIQSFQSSNSLIVTRNHRRPLPSAISIFPNLTILNYTALKRLQQFDNDYTNLLLNEHTLIKSYEQEYNEDSLIMKRILTYSNYHMCLSTLTLLSNTSNGLEKLIQLLNQYLHSRLNNFNTKSIDKQIRILNKITDNHTLVEHLQRIRTDFKTIEQILILNHTNNSCIINLLDQLLDKRIHSNELISNINLYSLSQHTDVYFMSNDWPFLFMLHDRLLKKSSIDTLVNFAFFDYYRQFIYPYYQPHVQHLDNIQMNYENKYYAYTYYNNYSMSGCQIINSCFDILNCYHPSLLNQIIDNHNQTFLNTTKASVIDLVHYFRLLVEQSDNLFLNEKKRILNELNQMKISIGHYSSSSNVSLTNEFSSYIEFVEYYYSMPFDRQERSYYFEPIYYPLNHTLFIPFGFLSLWKNSLEYPVIKILLKILRLTIQSNPFHIECLLKSSDEEHELINTTKLSISDESITYLLLRSKFISDMKLISDEYLWPFTNANSLMKAYLIDYTANNYCRNLNGYNSYMNNTHFIDDIHLIFNCQQASSIKQSKCIVA